MSLDDKDEIIQTVIKQFVYKSSIIADGYIRFKYFSLGKYNNIQYKIHIIKKISFDIQDNIQNYLNKFCYKINCNYLGVILLNRLVLAICKVTCNEQSFILIIKKIKVCIY